MAQRSEFIEHLLELLHPIGHIDSRRMFGGYGLFYHGLMFALVSDDVLYLKTDVQTSATFEKQKLKAFSYNRNGKPVSLSYHEAPGETLEDSEKMCQWALNAIAAAKRQAHK
jgi:DNA transformation protein